MANCNCGLTPKLQTQSINSAQISTFAVFTTNTKHADCGRIEKTSRKEIQALMGGAQIILATPPTFELI